MEVSPELLVSVYLVQIDSNKLTNLILRLEGPAKEHVARLVPGSAGPRLDIFCQPVDAACKC